MNSSDFKTTARQALTGKWGKTVLAFFLYYLIFLIFNIIENTIESPSINLLFSIVRLIITVPLGYGLTYTLLKNYNNEDVKSSDFFTLGFKNFSKSWGIALNILIKMLLPIILTTICGLIASCYMTKIVLSSMPTEAQITTPVLSSFEIALLTITSIGSIALSIWAIVKYYLYVLAEYILMENQDLTPKQAVEKSSVLMKGNRGKLFTLQLSFIGWIILCFFTFGIGIFWLFPYISFSTIAFYKYLTENKEDDKNKIIDNSDEVIIEK